MLILRDFFKQPLKKLLVIDLRQNNIKADINDHNTIKKLKKFNIKVII